MPPTWIEAMLNEFSEKVGVVTGITTMESQNFFHELQGIEWLNSLFIMFWFAKMDIPLTGMGNNMAITREAYWQTGGYEHIGFSITEGQTKTRPNGLWHFGPTRGQSGHRRCTGR